MNQLTTAIILILGLTVSQARLTRGLCPDVKVQDDFKIDLFVGTWYEQARDKFTPWQRMDCAQSTYGLDAEGGLQISNWEYGLKSRKHNTAEGHGACSGPNCFIKFHNFFGDMIGELNVLSTDYENYAIVQSCHNYLDWFSLDYVWVLTRE